VATPCASTTSPTALRCACTLPSAFAPLPPASADTTERPVAREEASAAHQHRRGGTPSWPCACSDAMWTIPPLNALLLLQKPRVSRDDGGCCGCSGSCGAKTVASPHSLSVQWVTCSRMQLRCVHLPSLSHPSLRQTGLFLFIFYTLLSAASVDRFQQHPTCQRSQTPSWLSRVSSRRCGDWERKRSAVAEWSR
jgi:hypothetical protein